MMPNIVERFTPRIDPANLVRQERAVEPFDRVVVRGYGQLEIVQGLAPALTIVSQAEVIDRIGSQVADGRLALGFESWWDKVRQSFSTSLDRQPIFYRLTVTDLTGLETQGLARVRGRGLGGRSFSINVKGLADIQLSQFQAQKLVVAMAPGGRVLLDGQVEEQRITIRGPGAYLAPDLASQRARITIQGPGQATVNVQEQLRVRVTGPGYVTYAGSPQVDKRLMGAAVLRSLHGYRPAAG